MKKFVITFIIMFVILFSGIYVCKFTTLPVKISTYLEDLYYNISGQEEMTYDKDFIVNDLDKSNSMATFYFDNLTENEKNIYTSVIYAIKELNTKAYLRKYESVSEENTTNEVANAIRAILLDHPEIYYLNENYTISTNTSIFGTKVYVLLSYDVGSIAELNNQINTLNSKIDEVFETQINNEDTVYDIELKLHDYLAKSVKYYDYTDINSIPKDCHSIYGTLINNEAVCDGFAETLKIMLDKKQIDSITVIGKLDTEPHEWNKIKIDEKWYNVDITSNKSIKGYDDVVIHSYFNIPDNVISQTHSFDNADVLPQADSLDNNFFYTNNMVIKNTDNFSSKFTSIYNKFSDSKILEIWCDGINNVPDKMVSALRSIPNNSFLARNDTKFSYYKILNSYVIIKK